MECPTVAPFCGACVRGRGVLSIVGVGSYWKRSTHCVGAASLRGLSTAAVVGVTGEG